MGGCSGDAILPFFITSNFWLFHVTIQPGLRIYCADREKMIQERKNLIAADDFK